MKQTIVALCLLLAGCGGVTSASAPAVVPLAAPSASAPATTRPAPRGAPARPTFDRRAHSLSDPRSPWVVVNRSRAIRPLDFRPDLAIVRGYQVAEPAAGPLTRLLAASERAGLGLKIASAFRSYAYQDGVHARLVAATGERHADRFSAAPGHSEHQTGLAVDLITPATPTCDLDPCFARTRAGRWLARHAVRYGFVVRYTRADQRVTGYAPEPWHLRFVGRPLARELRRERVATLEEFFGL